MQGDEVRAGELVQRRGDGAFAFGVLRPDPFAGGFFGEGEQQPAEPGVLLAERGFSALRAPVVLALPCVSG